MNHDKQQRFIALMEADQEASIFKVAKELGLTEDETLEAIAAWREHVIATGAMDNYIFRGEK